MKEDAPPMPLLWESIKAQATIQGPSPCFSLVNISIHARL